MKLTILLTGVGSLLGFAYASFSGCDPSACISFTTSTSTVFGAFAGLLVALPINLTIKKK